MECYVIGRAPQPETYPNATLVALELPQISSHHALVEVYSDEYVYVTDLNSLNGTYVNDEQERLPPNTRRQVTFQDTLFFGSCRYPLRRLKQEEQLVSFSLGASSKETKQTILIGRAKENHIVLDSPLVSAFHAVLIQEDGIFYLEDLNSTNGTFVQGRSISARTPVHESDSIVIGNHLLLFDGEKLTTQQYQKDLRIDAKNIVYLGRENTRLLDDISVSFYPSEIVALMGPSGAGKSTLLKCLVGLHSPNAGEILINDRSLYLNYDQFRGMIGYVPQEDLLFGELTIQESLFYTGRIRLPKDWTTDMIEKQIEQVLKQLDLAKHRDKPVKVLSGGQRKRVNLAQELITDPSVLFLDEPTSGLSSRDSLVVLEILRELANQGKTIILTIHQPSVRLYEMMDQLLLLAGGGKLAYFGPTKKSYDYFTAEQKNADEILLKLEDKSPEVWKEQYLSHPLYGEYVQKRQRTKHSFQESPSRLRSKWSLSQWWLLSKRYLHIKRKDKANTLLLLFQAPLIALLISVVLQGMKSRIIDGLDEITPFFFLCLASLWFGCSNAIREIVVEREMFIRERMVNLKLSAYVLSKFGVLSLLSLGQCLALLLICRSLLGLKGDLVLLFGLLWLTSSSGVALGLALSAWARTPASASSVLPLILIPQILLSGYVIPLSQTSHSVQIASFFAVTRWSFESIVHIRYRVCENALASNLSDRCALPKTFRLDAVNRGRGKAEKIECCRENVDKSQLTGAARKQVCPSDLEIQRDLFQELGVSPLVVIRKDHQVKNESIPFYNAIILFSWTLFYLGLSMSFLRRNVPRHLSR